MCEMRRELPSSPDGPEGQNVPFKRHALQVRSLRDPSKHVPRCSANSLFIQSITARTQAERRRSRWTMIQYSAAIFGDRRRQPARAAGWPSPT